MADGNPNTLPYVSDCPECAAGKHGNCDGTTWDRFTDAPTQCPCFDPVHPWQNAEADRGQG